MDQIQKQIDDLARMQKDELAKIMNESKRVDDTKKHMAEKVSDLIRTVEAIRLLVEPGVPRVFPPRKRPRVVHLSNQDQNVSANCFDGFGAVLVTYWSDVNFELAGELLAGVVQRGGTAVLCCFGNSTTYQAPKGSFEKYHALVPSPDNSADVTLGRILVPGHPLVYGISNISQGSDKRRMNGALAPGAQLIAEWNDGTPLAAVRVCTGVVVSLAFQIGNVGATGDAMDMVWNALML